MNTKTPKSSGKHVYRESSSGQFLGGKDSVNSPQRWSKLSVIARHANGLPIVAGSDFGSDVTRQEALAAVRSVIARRSHGRFAVKS